MCVYVWLMSFQKYLQSYTRVGVVWLKYVKKWTREKEIIIATGFDFLPSSFFFLLLQ